LISLFFFLTIPSLLYPASYWWEKGDEGWFFYKDPPKEEKKGEEKPEIRIETPKIPPQPLFTERMKRWGEELLSRALENPTMENVKAYMEYNKLMIELSENFSLAWQKVLMIYPELGSLVPVSDADKDLYFEAVKEKEKDILYNLSKRAGLFFFYTSSCPYCERQAYYLNRFRLENPFFIIKPVSLDGTIFPEFPDTVFDNGISQKLGIITVPSILLAFPPDRFERISSGLITADELKRRLIWYDKEIDTSLYNFIINR